MKQEKFEDALRHFARAIELKPEDMVARVNKGIALGKLGKSKGGIIMEPGASLKIDSGST